MSLTLQDWQMLWHDTEAFAEAIHKMFGHYVNKTPSLKYHRDWIEKNGMGMGERSFQWMWKLIIDEMPEKFTFLEIGVFCGQILSLVRMLADEQKKDAVIYGISPMDERGGEEPRDYFKLVEQVHDLQGIRKDYEIRQGLSQEQEIIDKTPPLDILYVDGNHSYEGALSDLKNYTPFIKPGGYLVVDDCANDFKMPWGYFQGIQEVTDAVRDFDKSGFEFVFSVVHNKIYKKRG